MQILQASPSFDTTRFTLPDAVAITLERRFPGHRFVRCRIDETQQTVDVEITYLGRTHWVICSRQGQILRHDTETAALQADKTLWVSERDLPKSILTYLQAAFPQGILDRVAATWHKQVITRYKVVMVCGNDRSEMEFYGNWVPAARG